MAFIIMFEGPYNKATRRFPMYEATVEGDMLHVMPGCEVSVVKDGDEVAYFSRVRSARDTGINLYEIATRGIGVGMSPLDQEWGAGKGRGY